MNLARGTVYLVGAGPGDPGLMTVRGLELLRGADVVVHDRLVARETLEEARADAEVLDVGKAPGKHRYSQDWIGAFLVSRAKSGRSVVRLKGGDPFVFGRGFEELTACREAGVPCFVIPGVTSVVAAPAAAGIPLTSRGVVRSVAIITGQVGCESPGPRLNYEALAAMDTIVILMGRANLGKVADRLIANGKARATPAACIERATTSSQRVVRATLGAIASAADRAGLEAPIVTVIGSVAAYASASAEEFWTLVDEASPIQRAV